MKAVQFYRVIKAKTIAELIRTTMENNWLLFLNGFAIGIGFELIRMHLTIGGLSFYKVFNDKNLIRELDKFEDNLKEREQRILKSIEKLRETNCSK
jgi:hypothetical protein